MKLKQAYLQSCNTISKKVTDKRISEQKMMVQDPGRMLKKYGMPWISKLHNFNLGTILLLYIKVNGTGIMAKQVHSYAVKNHIHLHCTHHDGVNNFHI